jgi:hypothetical protein
MSRQAVRIAHTSLDAETPTFIRAMHPIDNTAFVAMAETVV